MNIGVFKDMPKRICRRGERISNTGYLCANEKTIYKKDDKNSSTVERCHGRFTFHGFPNDSFQDFMHFPLELIPAQWVCNDFNSKRTCQTRGFIIQKRKEEEEDKKHAKYPRFYICQYFLRNPLVYTFDI